MVEDEYYACLGRIVFMPELTLNVKSDKVEI